MERPKSANRFFLASIFICLFQMLSLNNAVGDNNPAISPESVCNPLQKILEGNGGLSAADANKAIVLLRTLQTLQLTETEQNLAICVPSIIEANISNNSGVRAEGRIAYTALGTGNETLNAAIDLASSTRVIPVRNAALLIVDQDTKADRNRLRQLNIQKLIDLFSSEMDELDKKPAWPPLGPWSPDTQSTVKFMSIPEIADLTNEARLRVVLADHNWGAPLFGASVDISGSAHKHQVIEALQTALSELDQIYSTHGDDRQENAPYEQRVRALTQMLIFPVGLNPLRERENAGPTLGEFNPMPYKIGSPPAYPDVTTQWSEVINFPKADQDDLNDSFRVIIKEELRLDYWGLHEHHIHRLGNEDSLIRFLPIVKKQGIVLYDYGQLDAFNMVFWFNDERAVFDSYLQVLRSE